MASKEKGKFPVVLAVILSIVVVLAIAGAVLFNSITKSKTIDAYITNVDGDVRVSLGAQTLNAIDGMNLKEGAVIKTAKGTATVMLRESVLMNIEENTEISLSDISKTNVKVSQSKGSTWSKFTGLLGLTDYEVETPNAVATVRGTEFGVNTSDDGSNIIVGEGNVSCSDGESSEQVTSMEKCSASGDGLSTGGLSEGEKKMVLLNMRKTIANLMTLRVDELRKHETLVKKLMEMNDLEADKAEQYLEDLDAGKVNREEIKSAIPVKVESLDKIFAITDEIKDQKEKYNELAAENPAIASEVEAETALLLKLANTVDFL